MRIAAVCGKREWLNLLKKTAAEHGLLWDERRPEVVVSYGGDGTFLRSERLYPAIPKVVVRQSAVCRACLPLDMNDAMAALATHTLTRRSLPKLMARSFAGKGHKQFSAVNDFSIRNANQGKALRFSVRVGERLHENLIGDGLLVATPFGSSAYFSSITGKTFDEGIGVAFNNVDGRPEPIILSEHARVKITLIRGPATMAVDNYVPELLLCDGDSVEVTVSEEHVTLLVPQR